MVNSSSDTPGIDQPPGWIVIRKQQRSQPGPRALGIGPADHHELLAVQAFHFQPQAAIAGRVGRIGAFRNDALELKLAGLRMECRPVAAVIIAVMERRRDT